jgi:stage III sporulation protein AD
MDGYVRTVAGVLIAVILYTVLNRQSKDIALLLSLVVCCMVIAGAMAYLQPILDLFEKLRDLSQMSGTLYLAAMKAVGIGLISQIASMFCSDAGNTAMAKAVELLTAAAILWLAVPLMTELLELVQQMVGQV